MDEGLEISEEANGNILGSVYFSHSTGCQNNFNIEETGAGKIDLSLVSCTARNADYSNVEFEEFGSGNNEPNISSLTEENPSQSECIEIVQQNAGETKATFSFIDASGSPLQGVQIVHDNVQLFGVPNHTVNLYDMDCFNNSSHGVEIDIPGSGSLSVECTLGGTLQNNGKHGLKAARPSGWIPSFFVENNCYFINNGSDGIHAESSSVMHATIKDSYVWGNDDDGIQLDSSGSDNSCNITGALFNPIVS